MHATGSGAFEKHRILSSCHRRGSGGDGGTAASGTGTLIVGGSVRAAGLSVGRIAGQPFSSRAGVVAGGTVSTTVVDIAVRAVCSSPADTVPAG